MFDLGWGELVVIGIVALIAIGPKELPGVLRSIGQMMGKVRRMANEFQGQFQEAMREAELADLKKQADEMTTTLNSSVDEIANFDPLADTKKELADTQQELERSLDLPALDAPAEQAPSELPPPADQAPSTPTVDMPPQPSGVDDAAAAIEPPPPAKQAGGSA